MNEPYKGFIKKMILTMHKLLDDLKWQIEAGVDDSIGNELNKSIKNERNDVLINKITKPTEVINNETFDYRINGINTLKELKKFLQNNDICDLQKSCKNLIFSEINNDFKIMIISNIPDTDEDNLGEPIVKKNGELFDKILNAANLSRSSVYITPIIPWRIPGNRDLSDEEKSICIPIIKKQIEIINPKILILLGSDPLKYLLDDDGMMKKRGKWLEYHQNKKIIVCLPILDPSFLIRRPEYKRETWNDILNLKEKIKELV